MMDNETGVVATGWLMNVTVKESGRQDILKSTRFFISPKGF